MDTWLNALYVVSSVVTLIYALSDVKRRWGIIVPLLFLLSVSGVVIGILDIIHPNPGSLFESRFTGVMVMVMSLFPIYLARERMLSKKPPITSEDPKRGRGR